MRHHEGLLRLVTASHHTPVISQPHQYSDSSPVFVKLSSQPHTIYYMLQFWERLMTALDMRSRPPPTLMADALLCTRHRIIRQPLHRTLH